MPHNLNIKFNLNEKLKIFGIEPETTYEDSKDILKHFSESKGSIDVQEHLKRLKYCQENFQNNWLWSYSVIQSRFWFINPEDAVIFRLKFA